MTDTKRWSEMSSEVDPVLRSVMRYAQEQGPSPEQLQRLLRRTATAPAPARLRPRPARTFFTAVAAGLAVALGGLAWASYLGAPLVAPAAAPSGTEAPPVAPKDNHKAGRAPVAATPAEPAPTPLQLERSVVAPPSRSAFAPLASPSVAIESTPVESDNARDAAWLQQARAAIASDAARALVLIRDHEVHFPKSPLVEERRALQIEALAHVGRRAEAAQQFARFEEQFPRSPYRRRLSALVSP